MPIRPQDVYDDPDGHWDFLTTPADREFEGQLFDRKEGCRPRPDGSVSRSDIRALRDNIRECVSAFANANRDGGVLVVGIASDGSVRGLGHLNEKQINLLMKLDDVLVSHGCHSKLHQAAAEDGGQHEIALFLVSYAERAICETVGTNPRAWIRSGSQNLPLSRPHREQIERDKGIVDFERSPCSEYIEDELDTGVVEEFRKVFLDTASYDWTIHDLLRHVGAVSGDRRFTNAGVLFFRSNLQRELPRAYVRVLRFDVPLDRWQDRPPPSFDRSFSGPISKQIRDFRSFLKESGFFKVYLKRRPEGGFEELPELPPIAVDEAIVNAVAHRDYAIANTIRCEKYTDGLMVRSPGTLLQERWIPQHFSLDETRLEHRARNQMLMEWLRRLTDSQGNPFVLALEEGTRRMRDEMVKLGLPAPEYDVSGANTVVTLRSEAPRREAEEQASVEAETGEFANLYLISGLGLANGTDAARRLDFLVALKERLETNDWFIDRFRHGALVAHHRGIAHPAPEAVTRIVRIYPAVIFQFREHFGFRYLLVDMTVSVRSVLTAASLLELVDTGELTGLAGVVKWQGWERARLVSFEGGRCRVFLPDYAREEMVSADRVIPQLPLETIERLLRERGINHDLSGQIARAGSGLVVGATRLRSDRTRDLVIELANGVFPLRVGKAQASLSTRPLPLSRRDNGSPSLRVDEYSEPVVEFRMHRQEANIREGITQHGSFDYDRKDIELVPVCAPEEVDGMRSLIERLRTGRFRYKGAERTFGTRLTYRNLTAAAPADMEVECRRLVAQYPQWRGAEGWPRLFLVHCPERGHALDDERAPYYRIKRCLLEAGIPCQMVDTPTIRNPDYKDLNLALNIVAKCGVTPWVLPDSISDADFFVGLSYTRSTRNERARTMGFANVFNEYGRWEFYSGGGDTFSYEERTAHYEAMVSRTLERLSLSERPNICFHYSAKFSRQDRDAILRGARKVRPDGIYFFVWINRHHHVRFYDSRPDSDGSLARGKYVVGAQNQIYVSTTGQNPYRKALGTPKALEINVRVEGPEGERRPAPDLRAMAGQILSLTKLNWASTDSLCAEPITTKYAGDVAYLTAAFMRQNGSFRLHPVLERTPWFI